MRRASAPPWLDETCGWLAAVGPVVVGIVASSGWAQWHDDLSVVRDLGVVPVGGDGVLSMVLAQLSSLLPIGGRLLRATWVSAVALGVCGGLVYAVFRDSLGRHRSQGVTPLVAMIASALVSLSPVAQAEATRVGGALPAFALLLLGLRGIQTWRHSSDPRIPALLGLLTGLTACESQVAGAVLGGLFVLAWLFERRPLSQVSAATFLACGVFSGGVGSLFFWLRPLAANSWLDLGSAVLTASGSNPLPVLAGVSDWMALVSSEAVEGLGVILALLGVAGACVSLVRPSRIKRSAPLLALLALGASQPLFAAAGLERATALASLALAAGLSGHAASLLHWGFRALRTAEVPYTAPVGPLVIALGLALVLRGLDRVPVPAQIQQTGAEAWVEEALGKLPPRALVLVRHEATAYRLLASRVLHGYRPDVISVPAPLLGRGSMARDLLTMEPELSPLLRQLAVHGFADEYSLSRLADARPLFVELDPNWDVRLIEHLRPEPMWLGFAAHALGSSDRVAGLKRSQKAFQRVVAASGKGLDPVTEQILAGVAEQQALVLASLGDRQGLDTALGVLQRLEPKALLVPELRRRMAVRSRGRVAVADLID